MTWLLALWENPLVRKVVLYAAIALAVLYGLRLWGNKQWAKGEQQGRVSAAVEMEKDLKAAWKAREVALSDAAKNLAFERQTWATQTAELARARAGLQDSLSRSLNQIKTTHEADNAKVIAVAPDQLDAALRTLSAELAAGTAH